MSFKKGDRLKLKDTIRLQQKDIDKGFSFDKIYVVEKYDDYGAKVWFSNFQEGNDFNARAFIKVGNIEVGFLINMDF